MFSRPRRAGCALGSYSLDDDDDDGRVTSPAAGGAGFLCCARLRGCSRTPARKFEPTPSQIPDGGGGGHYYYYYYYHHHHSTPHLKAHSRLLQRAPKSCSWPGARNFAYNYYYYGANANYPHPGTKGSRTERATGAGTRKRARNNSESVSTAGSFLLWHLACSSEKRAVCFIIHHRHTRKIICLRGSTQMQVFRLTSFSATVQQSNERQISIA